MNESVLKQIERIDREVHALRARIEAEGGEHLIPRRVRFLKAVAEQGGIVTVEELRQLGTTHGYDARGLGGFFVGNGSLRRLTDGRSVITPRGEGELEPYEVEPPVRRTGIWSWHRHPAVRVKGKPLSEMVIEDRR